MDHRRRQHMQSNGLQIIEPTVEGEQSWVDHHDEIANATLVPKSHSWYTGANVPGKPTGRLLSYIGGVGAYREECEGGRHPRFRFS